MNCNLVQFRKYLSFEFKIRKIQSIIIIIIVIIIGIIASNMGKWMCEWNERRATTQQKKMKIPNRV